MEDNILTVPKTEIKWPGPVTFQEDDPKKGYVYIFLDIPELATKGLTFFKGKKPDNVEISCNFSESEISVEVEVKSTDKITKYVYYKPSPEDIDKSKCQYKVKNGKLLLQVKKAGPVTWTIHSRHFIQKPIMLPQAGDSDEQKCPSANKQSPPCHSAAEASITASTTTSSTTLTTDAW